MSMPTLAQNTTPAGSSVPEQRSQDADLQQTRNASKADKAAERKANKEARKAKKQEMKMNRSNGASSSQNTMDSTNSRMNTSSNSTMSSPNTGNMSMAQDSSNQKGTTGSGTTNGTPLNTSNGTGYTTGQATQTSTGSTSGATGSAGQSGSATSSQNTGNSSAAGMAGNATGNMNTPAATGTGQAVNTAQTTAPITTYSPNVAKTISIADFAASQPDYSTLQNALQSAGLVETLQGSGKSYTVFAPSNVAFKKLPAKTQNTLLNGTNKESLKALLTYHVVDGTLDGQALREQINAGNGKAMLTTLAGGKLTADVAPDGRFRLTDEQGGVCYVDTPDQMATNGVVHGVDKVLLPKGVAVMFK